MFKKQERLRRSEFSACFKTGKRCHGKYCAVIADVNSGLLKTSVVVSKKVAKSAVRRNTLKRRVYAVLRKAVMDSGYRGCVIVIIKPTLNSLPRKTANQVVQQSIADCLKSA